MTPEATKPQYRIRNWSAYNAALKQRGSLTVWIDEEVLAGWLNTDISNVNYFGGSRQLEWRVSPL